MSIGRYEELFFKANRLMSQHKFKRAERVLRQAIRYKNDDPCSWTNLGAALKAQGKYDTAITAFKKAITLNPDHMNAWLNLGTALFEMGDEKGSRWAFEQASKANLELFVSTVEDVGVAMSDALIKRSAEEL